MWVLPTYNRPDKAQKTLDSIIENGSQTPGLVFLDGVTNPAYQHLRLPNGWNVYEKQQNGGVCAALNDVFTHFPNLKWYGFLTDDSLVRTFGFDEKLLLHMDPFSIVHSNDGWRSNNRIHGAVLFGGELLRALGWWVPPGLVHSFCDDVWELIAERAFLRKYIPEVLVEHQHFANGKAPLDAGYLKAYASFDADERAFLEWKREKLSATMHRLRACFTRSSFIPSE